MYYLQERWKLQNGKLKYYGLRNKPVMFKNTVKLSKAQSQIIEKLPCELTDFELQKLRGLLGVQVVDEKHKKRTPTSLDEARFCVNCAANDFIIPGLEFDENGLCPMCQNAEDTKKLKSEVPV
ncbi:MAG: hypothetical protein K2J16_06290, partial [Clostridia bacterium]|nr:hypothetical protein [Clostridia bacterium]